MEVRVYKVNVGWVIVEVAIANLDHPVDAGLIAELSKDYEEILVGLPEGSVSPCSLALAYLYTLEDLRSGSRVKSKAILFLMNLLGLKQVRDVVETVRECRVIAVVGEEGAPARVLEDVLTRMGLKQFNRSQSEAKCEVSDLGKVTLSRVDRI